MQIFRLVAIALMPVALAAFSTAASAQMQSTATAQPAMAQPAASPSPSQVKAAVKQALMSVDLTMRQKRDIHAMVQSYESQTANADAATKQTAQKTLLTNIYQKLTPTQQTQFKASIKQSLGEDMQ